MIKDILIEEATEPELTVIRYLLAELISTTEERKGIDINKAIENCCTLLNDPNYHLLVAKVSDSVVGFVSFSIRKTALHSGPSGLIDELIVTKEHCGKGIGRHLILAAIDKCRQLGCSEVEVSTERANTKARKFYKSCGFEEGAVLLEMQLEKGDYE